MGRLRAVLLAAAALAAAGCGGRAALKTGEPAGREAIAGRAEAAPETAAEKAGLGRGQADIFAGKILGKDSEGCTWVEGNASVVVGDQDSRHQARAAAIEQARSAAVQGFLGVDINSKFMDFQQEGLRGDARLTENILQTTRNGRILKESIMEEGYRDAPDCPSCRYHVILKACVLPLDPTADKLFRVDLQINRVRFVSGDQATLTITATRDCSVYLYDVYDLGEKDKTALVVPNEAVPSKTLKAGETWEYPDADAKARGVKLVAELPRPGDTVSAEVIRVIAAETPLPAAVYDPTDGGYLGVLRRLHRSRTQWAEDAEAYTIYNK